MSIVELNFGERCQIKSIESETSYLLELGFLPGETIEVVSKAPFNGPISFRVKGTTIALRYEEAQHIIC